MGFDAGRLSRGELVAGGGGALLFASLFFLPWFAIPARTGRLAGASASLDGWHALTTTRWIMVVTIAVSASVVLLTATRRAPAVPITLSMLCWVLGGLSSLLLLYRIVDHPGLSARAGIYVGVIAALAVGYGGYVSLRTEGSTFGDPRTVETVPPGGTQSGSAGRTESTSAGRPGS